MNNMTFDEIVKNYWNYYLQLEKQVLETQRYVDFCSLNNATYSIEYLQLYLAICSEIDVIAKVIAKEKNPSFNGNNINKWGPAIDDAITDIQNKRVVFNNDYSVEPWKNWYHIPYTTSKGQNAKKLKDKCKNPEWWTLYNKVKHHRTSIYKNDRMYFTCANLKNIVLSLAALYILESHLLNEKNNTSQEYQKGLLYQLQPGSHSSDEQ